MGGGRKIIDENNNRLFVIFSPSAHLLPSAPRSKLAFRTCLPKKILAWDVFRFPNGPSMTDSG